MSTPRVGLAELARVFLKIGAMSYGGPAIMGIMQHELQEKRGWVDKKQFVDGLALVNMLPGPGATQLGIFIGHAKAGVAGGIVAGVCFILPAFCIMLALAGAYAAWGAVPAMRDAFYGIGPVMLGIFAVAVYRLGRNAIKDRAQIAIGVATVLALVLSPVGLIVALMLAGCVGIALYDTRGHALVGMGVLGVGWLVTSALAGTVTLPVAATSSAPTGSLTDVGLFFFKVGAFTFGGGLSMIAFIEAQVVGHLAWLSPQEFVDGLALGQVTPGPILMVAAFVGFKLHGAVGAAVAAMAIFLPSFIMMLIVLPLLRRAGDLAWLKAFMRGVAPAVIGALVVALVQMAPHAAPDWFTWVVFAGTVALLLRTKTGVLTLLVGGGMLGLIARRTALAGVIALVGAWVSTAPPVQAGRAPTLSGEIVMPGSEPAYIIPPQYLATHH